MAFDVLTLNECLLLYRLESPAYTAPHQLHTPQQPYSSVPGNNSQRAGRGSETSCHPLGKLLSLLCLFKHHLCSNRGRPLHEKLIICAIDLCNLSNVQVGSLCLYQMHCVWFFLICFDYVEDGLQQVFVEYFSRILEHFTQQ